MNDDLSPDEPSDLDPCPGEPANPDELDMSDLDAGDLDQADIPCTDDGDDERWEAFIPDDDQRDPEPDPGDFWLESRKDKATRSRGDREIVESRPALLVS